MHGAIREERGLFTVLFALVPLVKIIVFVDITQQVEEKGNNVIHHLTISSVVQYHSQ
jgi:hypothetical protein